MVNLNENQLVVLIVLNSSPSPLSLEAIGLRLKFKENLSSDIEDLESHSYVRNEGGYTITQVGVEILGGLLDYDQVVFLED